MSRRDLTDEERQWQAEIRRGEKVARMPDAPNPGEMAAMYRQRIPTGPVKPPVRWPSRAAANKAGYNDWRIQAMRGKGLETAAQTAADQGYTVDDVAQMISQYAAGGGGGGGGGRGGRGGGGGGGAGGGGLSKKDIDAAIKAITEANVAAQESIKGIYANADKTLADLTAEYAAAQAALGAGAGRTLGAFGVAGQQLNPVGMTPQDYLTTTRGTLTGLSAAEIARLKQLEAAYPLLAADLLKNL